MPFAVEYRLHDLLGVAGATVVFILAGAILMGGFTAKYVHLFERYRGLTGEFRQIPGNNPRKDSLREQITNYRRRIHVVNIASICMAVALLLFLFTVAIASLSVVYPTLPYLRLLGTVGVLGGLALSAAAVALELGETILSRHVIRDEVSDLPSIPTEDAVQKVSGSQFETASNKGS